MATKATAEDGDTFSNGTDIDRKTIRWNQQRVFLNNLSRRTMDGKVAKKLAPCRILKYAIAMLPELLEH